jgi:hypothetical protein
MGYTHDTHMSKIIPVSLFQIAGTCVLTHSVASNLVKSARTANDTAFSVWIPIVLDQNSSAFKGARLKSIDVFFKVATDVLTSFTAPALQKITLGAADATAPTGAELTTTYLPANATILTAAEHKVTVTVTTPEWADDDTYYLLDLEVDPTASAVVTFYGARANFDLRV